MIILIGNYPLDRQESMERFAQMLLEGFRKEGIETIIWRPVVLFARFFDNTTTGMGKWFGYIDKWIIFPLLLRHRLFYNKRYRKARFHICDHSNSPYLNHLPLQQTAITCHDVLAIRGALGYQDAYCPASPMGKILQSWILKNLTKANLIACVSQRTLTQLKELTHSDVIKHKSWRVIYNSFNSEFSKLDFEQTKDVLKENGLDINRPFILHVGSKLPRKNRKMLLDLIYQMNGKWNGLVCFAGQPVDTVLWDKAESLGITDQVISVKKPDHRTLLALYSSCEAFIFPSYSEGFGWPLIEAQACGAPVIASNIEPLPEVSGGTALHCHPDKPQEFAESLQKLQNKDFKDQIVKAGFENVKRFEPQIMIRSYLELHNLTA